MVDIILSWLAPARRISEGTVENVRYHRDAAPVPDHKNEDVYFVIENERFYACAVCDGHDGASAATFAVENIKYYIDSNLERWLQNDCVETKLKQCILLTDGNFFKQRRKYIEEKRRIKVQIPDVSTVVCEAFEAHHPTTYVES